MTTTPESEAGVIPCDEHGVPLYYNSQNLSPAARAAIKDKAARRATPRAKAERRSVVK